MYYSVKDKKPFYPWMKRLATVRKYITCLCDKALHSGLYQNMSDAHNEQL
jgi:hypothetical protein